MIKKFVIVGAAAAALVMTAATGASATSGNYITGTKSCPSGEFIKISYNWTPGTNGTISVQAPIGSQLFGDSGVNNTHSVSTSWTTSLRSGSWKVDASVTGHVNSASASCQPGV